MIPSKNPADLSEAARRLLRSNRADGRSSDLADDEIPAAREIAEAHLGTLSLSNYGNTLTIQPTAKHFAVADGSGDDAEGDAWGLYAEVSLLERYATDDGVLLAALRGAKFEQQDRNRNLPWAQWRLSVRHATAVDCDHSSSYLADLAIDNPQPVRIDGHGTVMVGTLREIRIYPTGTDITLINDRNRAELLTEPEMCDYGYCADKPHPFGPYLPEEREELNAYLGKPVRITLQPMNNVDAHGLRQGRSTINDRRTEEEK